jgi:hypothetical protein
MMIGLDMNALLRFCDDYDPAQRNRERAPLRSTAIFDRDALKSGEPFRSVPAGA